MEKNLNHLFQPDASGFGILTRRGEKIWG